MVRTTGWVHVVAHEDDGDYHIQITNAKTSGNHCLIAELPRDEAKFEKDATLRADLKPLRAFMRKELLKPSQNDFGEGGNWMMGECYMTVTGQLFFDDWHVGEKARGKQPNGHWQSSHAVGAPPSDRYSLRPEAQLRR